MDKITITDIPIELFDKLLLLISGSQISDADRDEIRENFMLIRKNFQHKLDELKVEKDKQPTEDEYLKSANPTSAEHRK
jgi:hypothetical protein